MQELLYILIQVLIICLAAGLILWGIREAGTPEPIARILRVLVIVIVGIWIIYLLAALLQPGHLFIPPR